MFGGFAALATFLGTRSRRSASLKGHDASTGESVSGMAGIELASGEEHVGLT
jgi:hypothetical protein